MKGTYRKRGSTWYYQVKLGRDPQTGEQIVKTKGGFKRKQDAEAACAELINLHHRGHTVSNHRMTFGEFFESWLDIKKDSLKKNTFLTYTRHAKAHILPELGHLEIKKVKYTDIEKVQKKLLREKGLSARSVYDIMKIVRSCFEDAVGKELIYKNPCKTVPLPKAEKPKIEVWDDDQVMRFLESTEDDPLYAAFVLALTTGMRQGEVLGLRWSNVDFDRRTLSVEQTLSHDGQDLDETPKTSSSRRLIVLSDTALAVLKKRRNIVNHQKMIARNVYRDNNLVICTAIGTPVIPRNCLRSLYRLAERASLPKISFHDLRHTFATLLLTSGEHPKIVAEILGHSSVRVTLDTYSHVLPTMQLKTAGRIDKIFGKLADIG